MKRSTLSLPRKKELVPCIILKRKKSTQQLISYWLPLYSYLCTDQTCNVLSVSFLVDRHELFSFTYFVQTALCSIISVFLHLYRSYNPILHLCWLMIVSDECRWMLKATKSLPVQLFIVKPAVKWLLLPMFVIDCTRAYYNCRLWSGGSYVTLRGHCFGE